MSNYIDKFLFKISYFKRMKEWKFINENRFFIVSIILALTVVFASNTSFNTFAELLMKEILFFAVCYSPLIIVKIYLLTKYYRRFRGVKNETLQIDITNKTVLYSFEKGRYVSVWTTNFDSISKAFVDVPGAILRLESEFECSVYSKTNLISPISSQKHNSLRLYSYLANLDGLLQVIMLNTSAEVLVKSD